jgi:rhamnogalacturonyl hydrolase YesR
MKLTPRLVSLFFSTVLATASAASESYFADWPAGTEPAVIGRRVANNFVARQFEWQTNPERRKIVIYPEVCTWYGSLRVAKHAGDAALRESLVRKYDILLTPEGSTKISQRAHVDDRVFGVVPLEIYLQTKAEGFLATGKGLADAQWSETTPDGITKEARYWIDDMYMVPALQMQAYRATGDTIYRDRAALAMSAYLDKLQKANGLFFHAPDSPFFWGRGNGWFAAGMAEILADLPADHPQHARIMRGYREMMAALLATQAENGLWRQLLDVKGSWTESSCTGMFTFALVRGVKRGWLDAATYGPAARKGWLGLVTCVGDDGNVTDVCVGTNKGYSVEYYMDRRRIVGDPHGQAAATWAAFALLE